MAQSGYTPILIYASGTTGNTPSAGNLTSSASGAELALNYFDGKLFYKDASGNVQTIASKNAAAGTFTTLNVTGNSTLGTNTSNTLTLNALVNSNMLFTDATYDIGASGANRPRNLYLSSNVYGSAYTMTGQSLINVTSTTSTVAATASLVLRNRTTASGTYMTGGLFADTYRDSSDPMYSAGVWFESVSNGSPTVTNTGGRIVFGTISSLGSIALPTKRMVVQPAGNVSVGFDAQIGQPLGAYNGISLLALNGASAFGTNGPRADITVTRVNNWKTVMGFYVNQSDSDVAPVLSAYIDQSGNLLVGGQTSASLSTGTSRKELSLAGSSDAYITFNDSTTFNSYLGGSASGTTLATVGSTNLTLATYSTARMTIGSPGWYNFSGSSFYNWGSMNFAAQIGTGGTIFATAQLNTRIGNNLYYDGTNYKQIATGAVAFMSINDNNQSFQFNTQASVGAGSTVTPYSKMIVSGAVGGATNSMQLQLGPNRSGSDSSRLTSQYDSTTLTTQDFYRIVNKGAYNTTDHYVGGILFSGWRDVRDPADLAAVTCYRESRAGGLSSSGQLRFHTGGGNSVEVDGVLPDFQMCILTSGEAIFKANGTNVVGVGYRVNVFGVGGSAVGATVDNNGNDNFAGWNNSGSKTFSVTGSGAVSKASGSFRIPHPLPSMAETHELVHSFIEGPQADLIYRGKVTLVNGRAEVNIDTASDMTDGTFVVLCREVQCFTTNESDWTPVRGSVSGNILTIESQDSSATSSISWLVIGERQDPHMMDTEWTDDNGKVIVEPLLKQQAQGAQA